VIDNLSVLAMPWVFTQSHPLSTGDISSEMKKRGADIDPATLRELYHRGDLRPLVELTTRRVAPRVPISDHPAAMGSTQAALRRALASGRVRDLWVGE